jgi:hypothetical protein
MVELMKTQTLFLALLTSLNALGQVQYLPKDAPAPYSGFLFTPEAEKANRARLLERDYFEQLDIQNKQLIQLQITQTTLVQEQSNLWKAQSENLAKQLAAVKENTFWKNLLYFSLGSILTTAIVFGVNKASK